MTALSFVPNSLPGNVLLPPVDSSCPDLLIFSNGSAQCWISLAADAPTGPNSPGSYTVPPDGGIVIQDTAANATSAVVLAQATGGTLTFQRVTKSALLVFPILKVR